jgi:hypothetical protein
MDSPSLMGNMDDDAAQNPSKPKCLICKSPLEPLYPEWGLDWWVCQRCRLRYAYIGSKGKTGEKKPPEK